MNKYDTKTIYCRKLGHFIPFLYCRRARDGDPCSHILDCWFGTFPIADYLKEHYSENEIQQIFSPPVPKLMTIIAIAEKAGKTVRGKRGIDDGI
ncbi:MAG: hypothetical protein JXB26_01715 [Candidatus Aminicenantes bacterium]|nr:hypothetical protein [Candidatus Aminicenantes bacterium]